MKPANKQFLDDNRHHWETLTRAMYLKGLNGNEREGMQRVMSEEFQPGYATDLWCPPCVSDMVLLLYRQYDLWLSANPIVVHASFPSDKSSKNELHTSNSSDRPKRNNGRR